MSETVKVLIRTSGWETVAHCGPDTLRLEFTREEMRDAIWRLRTVAESDAYWPQDQCSRFVDEEIGA